MAYSYLVSYSTSSTGPWTSTPTVNAPPDVISGLASNTNYYFRIITVDSVTGIQSVPVINGPFTTTGGVAESPPGTHVTAPSQQIYASWTGGAVPASGAAVGSGLDVWSITAVGGGITHNGAVQAGTAALIQLYYSGHNMYQNASNGNSFGTPGWWIWNGETNGVGGSWVDSPNPIPTVKTLGLGTIQNQVTNTPFNIVGSVEAYTTAPTLQYQDNTGVWNSLPSGSTVNTTSFSFTHPAVSTANGAFIVSVRDAATIVIASQSNEFQMVTPGQTALTGIRLTSGATKIGTGIAIPTTITFSSAAANGTVVGVITPVVAGTVLSATYSLSGTDAALFSISGTNLQVAGAAKSITSSPAGQTITDQYGNVWSITAGGQIAVNGAVSGPNTGSSGVVNLTLVGGTMYQRNTAGSWYSIPVLNWASNTYANNVAAPVTGIAPGAYNINISAAMSGATGSPFTQPFSLTSGASSAGGGLAPVPVVGGLITNGKQCISNPEVFGIAVYTGSNYFPATTTHKEFNGFASMTTEAGPWQSKVATVAGPNGFPLIRANPNGFGFNTWPSQGNYVSGGTISNCPEIDGLLAALKEMNYKGRVILGMGYTPISWLNVTGTPITNAYSIFGDMALQLAKYCISQSFPITWWEGPNEPMAHGISSPVNAAMCQGMRTAFQNAGAPYNTYNVGGPVSNNVPAYSDRAVYFTDLINTMGSGLGHINYHHYSNYAGNITNVLSNAVSGPQEYGAMVNLARGSTGAPVCISEYNVNGNGVIDLSQNTNEGAVFNTLAMLDSVKVGNLEMGAVWMGFEDSPGPENYGVINGPRTQNSGSGYAAWWIFPAGWALGRLAQFMTGTVINTATSPASVTISPGDGNGLYTMAVLNTGGFGIALVNYFNSTKTVNITIASNPTSITYFEVSGSNLQGFTKTITNSQLTGLTLPSMSVVILSP